MNTPLIIDGKSLTIDDILSVACYGRKVKVADHAVSHVKQSRKILEKLVADGRIMYGVNTGFGRFAEITIPGSEINELQKNLVLSHAAGVGPLLPETVVRMIMLLKINTLVTGLPGVRIEVVNTLRDMLNAQVHPLIPSQGSVGASGDLAPLAHMVLVLIGKGKAFYRGRAGTGRSIMKRAGIPLLDLQAKEGLSLLNGTQAMTAVGLEALTGALNLFRFADVAGAMTVEALSGSAAPFDARIQKARGQKGQIIVAANLRNLLKGSEILEQRPVKRIQEAYSQRCMPQVHGAGRDAVAYVRSVLENEINGVTDNPLLFFEENEVVSGGNFHGEPLAIALDVLGIAVSSLGAMSERRIAHMMDAVASGLPGFLARKQGIHSGFMIAQITAASLVSENKIYAHPASVDSIPTSANQEDYVSMGMSSANKSLRIIENTRNILAIEMLCAAQGIEYRSPLKPSPSLLAILGAFRKVIPRLEKDRVIAPDIEKAAEWIGSGLWERILKDNKIA